MFIRMSMSALLSAQTSSQMYVHISAHTSGDMPMHARHLCKRLRMCLHACLNTHVPVCTSVHMSIHARRQLAVANRGLAQVDTSVIVGPVGACSAHRAGPHLEALRSEAREGVYIQLTTQHSYCSCDCRPGDVITRRGRGPESSRTSGASEPDRG